MEYKEIVMIASGSAKIIEQEKTYFKNVFLVEVVSKQKPPFIDILN